MSETETQDPSNQSESELSAEVATRDRLFLNWTLRNHIIEALLGGADNDWISRIGTQ